MFGQNAQEGGAGDNILVEQFETSHKGCLVVSLRKVLEQVHPKLSATEDAVNHVENLCIKLLGMLCLDFPKTIQDVEDRVKKTFPNPIDKWALTEARDTIDKSKKKKLILPHDKIHNFLKEVLQYKIDNSVTLFLVAILEYISADILKLAGNYVRTIKHDEISREDIQLAMCADKVLMDMFDQEEGGDGHSLSPSPLPPTPRASLSYEEMVKELISDEKQYQRDLHMIIQIFREELLRVWKDPQKLEVIFSNINDIYDLTVALLGSLEDAIEMAQERSPPCVGSVFEELAEAKEFEVYIQYTEDVTSKESRKALSDLLSRPEASSLSTAGHGFRVACKYYLPKLLLGPITHAFLYSDYTYILQQLSTVQEDKDSFEPVKGVLKPLQTKMTETLKESKIPKETLNRVNSRTRKQLAMEKIKELEKVVEHWDKDVGQNCNEFIREDMLEIQISGKRVKAFRKAFLFDGLLVLCKPINRNRQRGVSSNAPNYDFRLKERFHMRLVEIIDRPDTDELRHAFEIAPRDLQSVVLIAKNANHKCDVMADLIMLNTKSMLERLLDSILLEIEKKHPLRLPSPELYKFAEVDSPENIVLEEREMTNVPLIKGATLVKLVERLTYHIYADPMFLRTFLTTYRSFCTPRELLELLIERFNIPDLQITGGSGGCGSGGSGSSSSNVVVSNCSATTKTSDAATTADVDTEKLHRYSQREDWKKYKKEYVQPVQFRVLNVLRHWVDHHYYDFEHDTTLLTTLLDFLASCQGKPIRKWVEKMVSRIIQKKKSDQCDDNHRLITFAFGHSPPAIEKYLDVPDNEINLLTLHPLELARQLTLLEFEMYKNVKPTELVGAAWTKKDKETKSPNLLKITRHTTNFTRWIEKSIVEAENFEERMAIVTRAIEVMMVLLDLNNFNGVLAIVSAMGSASVFRLKLTFKELPARYQAFLSECGELSEDHFRKYQEKLRSINPPVVPFFGMYLTNIIHIEEGNSDWLASNSNLINFSKRRKIAEIIGEIQQYQNQPYCLNVDPKIRHFLENLDPFKDFVHNSVSDIQNYLYNESLKIEPRNCKQPPKFQRRWPDLSLKSPGIKPKNRSHSSTSSSLMSLPGTLPFVPRAATTGFSTAPSAISTNNNEVPLQSSEHSPPSNLSSSAHEFSVFANVQISGSSSSNNNSFLSHSNMSLNTISPSAVDSDSISLSPAANISMAPEVPRRSNSVISIPSHNFGDAFKPILSPRNVESIGSRVQAVQARQPLDSLNEEGSFSSLDTIVSGQQQQQQPMISPRTQDKSSPHHHQHHHASDGSSTETTASVLHGSMVTKVPGSPKHAAPPPPTSTTQLIDGDVGAIPISPHVNVTYQPFSSHNPPPLPPRAIPRRIEKTNIDTSHIKQAPGAPQLPPRDKSPPPLPPRTYVSSRHHSPHQSPFGQENSPRGPGMPPPLLPGKENLASHHNHLGEKCLMLPHTSTIMMRRNSAMERKEGGGSSSSSGNTVPPSPLLNNAATNTLNNSSHHHHHHASSSPSSAGDVFMGFQTDLKNSIAQCAPPPPPPLVGHRRQSSSTSPRYSPGDPLGSTTPKLPPKPKTSIVSNPDRNTMFPYPNPN